MRYALEDGDTRLADRKRHLEVAIAAPVGGWCSDASIAKENPGTAEVMDNFIPTTRGIRARGGSERFATVGLLSVQTLMPYYGTSTRSMFAVSGGNIYDVTSPASPTAVILPAVTGLTNSEMSHVSMSIAGTEFLLAFNGADLHRVYDGAAWATNTPAITGVDSSTVNQAWVHSNRIWMVPENSRKAWYLPVDSIGGAALDFVPAFRRGGKILFGATWSQDSGSGSADRCVFVSDQGDVEVYVGDYPGGSFALFGHYEIAKPLGRFAFEKVGSDLIIETVNGIVPMTEVITKDPAALTATAITRFIEPDWKSATRQYGEKNWHFLKWDQANLGVVAIPVETTTVTGSSYWGEFIWGVHPWGGDWEIEIPASVPICFVVNLQTGRWARVTGWDCRSMTVFNGEFYFGTSSGAVVKGDVGGNDMGFSYECRVAMWPSKFDYIGEKQFLQSTASFEHSTSFDPKITISTNNKINWAVAPAPPVEDNAGGAWDSAAWDVAVWDSKGEKTVTYKKWNSLGGRGRVGALLLQMTFNNSTTPKVEFTDAIVTYEKAAVVT